MPRRNNVRDFDFDIHVDPSCLSEPMNEEKQQRMEEESGEAAGVNTGLPQSPTADMDQHSSESTGTLAENEASETQTNKDLLDDISALAAEYANTSHQDLESEVGEDHDASVLSREDGSEHEDGYTNASESRRESTFSSTSEAPARRTSGRTEALIHAAARDIVAHIQHDHSHDDHRRESLQSTSIAEEESYISHSEPPSTRHSDIHESIGEESHVDEDGYIVQSQPASPRPSDAYHATVEDESYMSDSQPASARPSDIHEVLDEDRHGLADDLAADDDHIASVEDAGDNSSHHENDDVFSDHSPRSSVGSLSETDQKKMDDALSRMTRSPRISDVSRYQDEEDEEDFVPTVRGTPRPPFRSPSSVKAMQMSSPPGSVFGTPRSSRRTPLPTISRLGSPGVSAQFSPKRTPPRFRRNTPPLVLLHATLLPLRWAWGDVLDNASADELSESGKTLRDSWRQLQDRVGNTVLERGILLPHPQNDYEVLEERLLEALELPLRRRARILECGHYLGASNEMNLQEETESEDEDYYDGAKSSRPSVQRQFHWCSTCRSEIRYDSLGAGKVFRVKVYASNGLMKAGAWEACWKEMERVDIELEPIVEPGVQEELGHLAADQERALELQDAGDEDHEVDLDIEPESSFLVEENQHHMLPSSPVPEIRVTPSPDFDDRRRRDQERLREIYGHTPPTQTSPPMPSDAPSSEYTQRETPPSPSVEAFERREHRRQTYKSASLPELVLEAVRVMMLDRKNVAIVLLSVLILALAMRGGNDMGRMPETYQTIVREAMSTVTVTQGVFQETLEAISATVSFEDTPVVEETTASSEPCVSQTGEAASVEPEQVVRVVQTITETAVETQTVRVTATETYIEVETEVAKPAVEDATAEEKDEDEVKTAEAFESAEEAEPAETERAEIQPVDDAVEDEEQEL